MTMAARSGSAAGASVITGIGSSERRLNTISFGFESANGSRPDSILYATAPSE